MRDYDNPSRDSDVIDAPRDTRLSRRINSTSLTGDPVLLDFGFEDSETVYPLQEGAYRASLIGSFQEVFANSVYEENWDYETTSDFLSWTEEQDYQGKVAVDKGRVVGFVWGYRVEPDMEEKFPDKLQDIEQEFFDGETFVLDEIGVLPEYRGQGLGRELEEMYIEEVAARENTSRIIQRTQRSSENVAKLSLDASLDFTAVLDENYEPVTEEVSLVGLEGSDERIYLWREVDGDLS